jgi:hypothetical protein
LRIYLRHASSVTDEDEDDGVDTSDVSIALPAGVDDTDVVIELASLDDSDTRARLASCLASARRNCACEGAATERRELERASLQCMVLVRVVEVDSSRLITY